jgi:hypothetical protein
MSTSAVMRQKTTATTRPIVAEFNLDQALVNPFVTAVVAVVVPANVRRLCQVKKSFGSAMSLPPFS